MRNNAYGQPIGDPVVGWHPRPRPDFQTLTGSYCRLERLDPARHADDLLRADQAAANGTSWTYLPYGPFADRPAHAAWITQVAAQPDPYFFAVVDTENPRRRPALCALSLSKGTNPRALRQAQRADTGPLVC
jgi:hypothetical protein